jgi:hypothetical protein
LEPVERQPIKRVVSDLAETLQPTTDLTKLHAGTYAFFSPRNLPIATGTITPQLKSFVKLIDSARELVCMIFPFKYDAVFKKVFDQNATTYGYCCSKKPPRLQKQKQMKTVTMI